VQKHSGSISSNGHFQLVADKSLFLTLKINKHVLFTLFCIRYIYKKTHAFYTFNVLYRVHCNWRSRNAFNLVLCALSKPRHNFNNTGCNQLMHVNTTNQQTRHGDTLLSTYKQCHSQFKIWLPSTQKLASNSSTSHGLCICITAITCNSILTTKGKHRKRAISHRHQIYIINILIKATRQFHLFSTQNCPVEDEAYFR
jgi:hypothetical protein